MMMILRPEPPKEWIQWQKQSKNPKEPEISKKNSKLKIAPPLKKKDF